MLLVLGLMALLGVCTLFWTLSQPDLNLISADGESAHRMELDSEVAFLMGIGGSDLSGPSGTIILPQVEEEALLLPDRDLAVLGLRSRRVPDESLVLIWEPGLLDEGSNAASEFEAELMALMLEDGFDWRDVPEPPITPDLLVELDDFPMSVTRLEGSLAPQMGLFRIADRLGLEEFAFFGESEQDDLGFTTFSEDDDEWRLSVQLPPRLN